MTQITRVPPGHMNELRRSYTIMNLSVLKNLDHEVEVDHTNHLSEVWNIPLYLYYFQVDSPPKRLRRLQVTALAVKIGSVLSSH